MNLKLNNTVIKVLNKEHGAKVIRWWKSMGVDTGGYEGTNAADDARTYVYYGLVDNVFSNWNYGYLHHKSVNIITLPKMLEDLTEKDIIHCPTQKMWDKVIKLNPKNTVQSSSYRWGVCYKPAGDNNTGSICNIAICKEFGYTIHSAEDFFPPNYFTQQIKPMDKRFPFKLKLDQAKRIINAACPNWQQTLSNDWGKQLLLHDYVMVSETYYRNMRKACTQSQHELFDEIFGKDVPEWVPDDWITWSNGEITETVQLKEWTSHSYCRLKNGKEPFKHLCRPATPEEIEAATRFTAKKGEWVVITDFGTANPSNGFSLNKAYQLAEDLNPNNGFHCVTDNLGRSQNGWGNYSKLGINFRYATEEEIKLAQFPPEGTPCLVRDIIQDSWVLKYYKGGGTFAAKNAQIGYKWKLWLDLTKIDLNNIPE